MLDALLPVVEMLFPERGDGCEHIGRPQVGVVFHNLMPPRALQKVMPPEP